MGNPNFLSLQLLEHISQIILVTINVNWLNKLLSQYINRMAIHIISFRLNEASIKELAEMVVRKFERHPLRGKFPPFAGMQMMESARYYGAGYQDVAHRKPSIRKAQKLLGWKPAIRIPEGLEWLCGWVGQNLGLCRKILGI